MDNKCIYCECDYLDGFNHDIINTSVSPNDDYLYMDILNGKLEIEVELEYNIMVTNVDIRYCPKCGRKL